MNLENPLFILEFANNHNGSFEKGKQLIKEYYEVVKDYKNFNFGIKFQYRDIKTFIHPDRQKDFSHKYIKRFTENQLTNEEFFELKKYAQCLGFISICTAFDEVSVDLVIAQQYDILKIASCSFTDWSLLQHIAQYNLPIIASTAGSTIEQIDNVVNFFENRQKDLTLLHCIGEYPTKEKNLQLNQIDLLKSLFPNIHIGHSTHEEPDNYASIFISVAKGCKVFERHVDLNCKEINNYSSTPFDINMWLYNAELAFEMCGVENKRHEVSTKELNDLRQFKRGVFIKEEVKKGDILDLRKVFYAFPNSKDQLLANDLSKYNKYTLINDLKINQEVKISDVDVENTREDVLNALKKINKIIIDSKVKLPQKFKLQISHHYGLDKFNETGVAIIEIINREYCQKYLILLPNQNHPFHSHKIKEETFSVLYGDLDLVLYSNNNHLNPLKVILKEGELFTVEREIYHSFSSKIGCIFTEISTKHHNDDSYYIDKNIMKNYNNRKTILDIRLDWLKELK